jgi:hypothetical protein
MGALGTPSVRQVGQAKMNAQNMRRTSCDAVEQENRRRHKLGAFNRKLTSVGEERTLGR